METTYTQELTSGLSLIVDFPRGSALILGARGTVGGDDLRPRDLVPAAISLYSLH